MRLKLEEGLVTDELGLQQWKEWVPEHGWRNSLKQGEGSILLKVGGKLEGAGRGKFEGGDVGDHFDQEEHG